MQYLYKKLIFPVVLIGVVTGDALSQAPQVSEIIPPAPQAAKITEFQAQRPNLYTGTAQINIPLYTIDFDGWPLPLALSYNATGIRTNEEASEVGLGWALQATGVISRSIMGGNDLYNVAGLTPGYVYDTRPIQEIAYPPSPNAYYNALSTGLVDTEPDIFNYDFFGYSGSFVLSKKLPPENTISVIKLNQNAVRITYNEMENSFTVITPSGFKGTFDILERSTNLSAGGVISTPLDGWDNLIDILAIQDRGRLSPVTSWYLSSIESPYGKSITFTYDLAADGSSKYVSIGQPSFSEVNYTPPFSHSSFQLVNEHVYLETIESDEVRVTFNMEDRDDLKKNHLFTNDTYFPSDGKKPKRYVSIHVDGRNVASTLNKNITFNQTYFHQGYRNTEAATQWMRNRLDRVVIDQQEYRFFYKDDLPSKSTLAVDYFGFYNGKDQNTYLDGVSKSSNANGSGENGYCQIGRAHV